MSSQDGLTYPKSETKAKASNNKQIEQKDRNEKQYTNLLAYGTYLHTMLESCITRGLPPNHATISVAQTGFTGCSTKKS